ADPPARVRRHEVDVIGGDELGGHDEVALVLAVLVVDHDDHAPGGDLLERLFDRGEHGLRGAHARTPTSRSTYLASTSTSMFTGAPGSASPRFVRASVSGISETSNSRSSRRETVRDTPLTATYPFSTT